VKTPVYIVGGGIIGLLLARELATAGETVAVLDRGEVGRESSWAGAESWRRFIRGAIPRRLIGSRAGVNRLTLSLPGHYSRARGSMRNGPVPVC